MLGLDPVAATPLGSLTLVGPAATIIQVFYYSM